MKNPLVKVLEKAEKRRQRHKASELKIYAVRVGEEKDSPYGWPFFSFDDDSALKVMSSFEGLVGRKVYNLGSVWTDNGRVWSQPVRYVGVVPEYKEDDNAQ